MTGNVPEWATGTDRTDAKEEKRNMSLKRITIVMLSLMLLVSGFAQAAGLFPVAEQLFGVEMPSFGTVAGREAASVVETDQARQEDYRNVTLDEFRAFGCYLTYAGAELRDYTVETVSFCAEIFVQEQSMQFVYNWADGSVTVVYPSGTRPEEGDVKLTEGKGNIFSSIESELPSMRFAMDREPDESEKLSDGSYRETYREFSEEDYNAFSRYLTKNGFTLKDYSKQDDGSLTIDLENASGGAFTFIKDFPIISPIQLT